MPGGGLDMQALADRAAQVRARVALSGVIGRDVALRRQGREQTGLCPFHGDRSDGNFMVNDEKGIWHCFVCQVGGDVIDYVAKRAGRTFVQVLGELERDAGIDFTDARAKARIDGAAKARRDQSRADAAKRRHDARQLWLTAVSGKGTPAQAYLEGRGIDFAALGKWPGALRFRYDARHGLSRSNMPAMLAAIVDLKGDIVACHRTFLARGPKGWVKAAVEKPKLVLGDFAGASIAVWKGEHDKSLAKLVPGTAIWMSEGIEDALSVAMAEPWAHVRAGISLDNLGSVALPAQAGDLTLLAQRDGDARAAAAAAARAAGDMAAAERHERAAVTIEAAFARVIAGQQAQARAQGSGRQVRLAFPSPGFKDWNDELRGVAMEAA